MAKYMTALRLHFYGLPDLDWETEDLRQSLGKQLSRKQRKALLKLVDHLYARLETETDAAFLAGFRLAAGIANELGGEQYSAEEQENLRDGGME